MGFSAQRAITTAEKQAQKACRAEVKIAGIWERMLAYRPARPRSKK
jgi:hypothetical protein